MGLSMSVERRDLIQTGAAAAAVTPFLSGAKPAEAFMQKNSMAPVITVFDHQSCSRKPAEYRGPESGDADDERLVKVAQTKIAVSEQTAAKALTEFISYKGKGIDGDFTSAQGGSPSSAPSSSPKAAPKAAAKA